MAQTNSTTARLRASAAAIALASAATVTANPFDFSDDFNGGLDKVVQDEFNWIIFESANPAFEDTTTEIEAFEKKGDLFAGFEARNNPRLLSIGGVAANGWYMNTHEDWTLRMDVQFNPKLRRDDGAEQKLILGLATNPFPTLDNLEPAEDDPNPGTPGFGFLGTQYMGSGLALEFIATRPEVVGGAGPGTLITIQLTNYNVFPPEALDSTGPLGIPNFNGFVEISYDFDANFDPTDRDPVLTVQFARVTGKEPQTPFDAPLFGLFVIEGDETLPFATYPPLEEDDGGDDDPELITVETKARVFIAATNEFARGKMKAQRYGVDNFFVNPLGPTLAQLLGINQFAQQAVWGDEDPNAPAEFGEVNSIGAETTEIEIPGLDPVTVPLIDDRDIAVTLSQAERPSVPQIGLQLRLAGLPLPAEFVKQKDWNRAIKRAYKNDILPNLPGRRGKDRKDDIRFLRNLYSNALLREPFFLDYVELEWVLNFVDDEESRQQYRETLLERSPDNITPEG